MQIACHWQLNDYSALESGNVFSVVDVFFQLRDRAHGHYIKKSEIIAIDDLQHDKISSNGRAALERLFSSARKLLYGSFAKLGVKLILPCHTGHVIRSDVLRQRLMGCEIPVSTLQFMDAKQLVRAFDQTDFQSQGFADIVSCAVGAIITPSATREKIYEWMASLDTELRARLSYPWIISSPLSGNRLVVVGSRHRLVMADWFESVYNLGIRVTLIGAQNHFLQQQWRHYRAIEQYLAIDTTLDNELPSRIVEALRQHGGTFHGIATFKDPFFLPVAKVAEILGLPTAPLEAVTICLDKQLTRRAVQENLEILRVSSMEELERQMNVKPLKFPLIVKPCTGYGSEGVFRVSNKAELVKTITHLHSGSEKPDLAIDTYEDGPEIDANFVLYDGEMLFFELVDGFPCTADDKDSKEGNFLETDQLWPSQHSNREKDMLQNDLYAQLLKLGFRTGVFHVEARIQNSDMHYTTEDGIQDLRQRNDDDGQSMSRPSWFLLEVNQRPPGHGGFSSTKWVHGIDYMALHSLCALGQKDRVKALSQPFAFFPGGAQGWCDSVFINAEKPGIYDGEDIPKQVAEQRPDLMETVCFSACYYQHGETVLDDPPRIALFVITSKISRLDVRQRAQKLRSFAQKLVKVK